ncbi:MAG: low temperature requirement protein A [Proteobacteria bacterium]|nr:low temperature requirement protein A [Pseudomonadota bacterium]
MTAAPPDAEALHHHHRRRMGGRDPHEVHRVATPLELLFDLTFVTAFSLAAAQFAHLLAEGHIGAALAGFGFATFAICWAWINFTWFSSAYDTDDWIFRVVTMVQMTGVLVLATGLPRMFASVEHGVHLDNSVIVLGYVIMRVAMIFQWLRAAKQDPRRRAACMTYAMAISIAQIGWIVQIFLNFSLAVSAVLALILFFVELAGPIIAEKKNGGTPWHAHHVAERYSLFAIIALGEGVVGTLATLSAAVEDQGWTIDAALVCVAGTGLTFGMWWIFYVLPSAAVLHAHRERAFVWGYAQIVIVAAIAATGAGLHVAAYFIAHTAHLSPMATLLTVAIPVGIYLFAIYALYYYLVRSFDALHIWLLLGTAAVMGLAIGAALAGFGMAVCLVILTFAPVVTVVGYEVKGYRHQVAAIAPEPHQARPGT